jgi:hypothetical protein
MALIVALAWRRRLEVYLPGVVFAVLIVIALSSPKALDGTPSVYVGLGRYFLAVPAAVWFLCYVLAETNSRPSGLVFRGLAIAITALAVATFCYRQLDFDHRMAGILEPATDTRRAGAPLVSDAVILKHCQEVADLARRENVELAIFRGERVSAYACGALSYGKVETLFPFYERRTWLLHREAVRPRSAFLAFGVDAAWCQQARAVVLSCTVDPQSEALAVVRTKPAPAIETWRRLGEPVRPFSERS